MILHALFHYINKYNLCYLKLMETSMQQIENTSN